MVVTVALTKLAPGRTAPEVVVAATAVKVPPEVTAVAKTLSASTILDLPGITYTVFGCNMFGPVNSTGTAAIQPFTLFSLGFFSFAALEACLV